MHSTIIISVLVREYKCWPLVVKFHFAFDLFLPTRKGHTLYTVYLRDRELISFFFNPINSNILRINYQVINIQGNKILIRKVNKSTRSTHARTHTYIRSKFCRGGKVLGLHSKQPCMQEQNIFVQAIYLMKMHQLKFVFISFSTLSSGLVSPITSLLYN